VLFILFKSDISWRRCAKLFRPDEKIFTYHPLNYVFDPVIS